MVQCQHMVATLKDSCHLVLLASTVLALRMVCLTVHIVIQYYITVGHTMMLDLSVRVRECALIFLAT